MKLKPGMQVRIVTSSDRLYKGKIVEVTQTGWIVMALELGEKVHINPAHVVAIEE